jgi:predicted dehydrogenase
VRVFGSKGLMHSETDFSTWDTPDKLHLTSQLYIQRGKDGYGKREDLKVPASDMFSAELELFAESCRTGKANELTAHNGNVAVAVVNAALRSIDNQGQYVRIGDILGEARQRAEARKVNVA